MNAILAIAQGSLKNNSGIRFEPVTSQCWCDAPTK